MRIVMLEYYKEVQYEDFEVELYNLIGIYLTREEAIKEKNRISIEKNIKEKYLYVSMGTIGRLQWDGGFVCV